jgi:multidrug efflux pump subunit AcrA (membrane-fusion protein)
VGNGNRLARVYGTDVVEVRVPLDSRELAWFDVPSQSGGQGPEAEVGVTSGRMSASWKGRVTRMEAEVDPTSRMVNLVVEIPDPYRSSEDRPALLPGTFVDVQIFGRTLDRVVDIPRFAIHEGNQVWLFNDGTMEIREIEILRADRERALVGSGLGDGDLVVLTSLDAVTDGMALRIDSTGSATASEMSPSGVVEGPDAPPNLAPGPGDTPDEPENLGAGS